MIKKLHERENVTPGISGFEVSEMLLPLANTKQASGGPMVEGESPTQGAKKTTEYSGHLGMLSFSPLSGPVSENSSYFFP